MRKVSFLYLILIISANVSGFEHSGVSLSQHAGLRSRQGRKTMMGMAMAAAGGLAGGALIGSLLSKPSESEESQLAKLKQSYTVENGFFMHYSVERGNQVNQITTYAAKMDKELTDFGSECSQVIEDMKAAINNAAQSQNRHINRVTN